MQKSLYGESHPDVACTLNILEEVYGKQSDLEIAEQHYLEPLSLKKNFGEGHAHVANTLHNLGRVCLSVPGQSGES